MNINDVIVEVPDGWEQPTPEMILSMLERRKRIFRGFCQLEATQGFLAPPIALSSSKGQDSVRILTTRVLEEILESLDSSLPDHVLEELIDALNFLLAIPCLDDEAPLDLLASKMSEVVWPYPKVRPGQDYTGAPALEAYLIHLSALLESLRNRAWQKRSQSLYFDGWLPLINFVTYVWKAITEEFDTWDHFCWFYLAKEAVLQFRLDTNY